MTRIVQRLCLTLFLGLLSLTLLAQEKTQYYYNTHENEILPDANTSFKNGDYERTVELCNWYYIIVGSHDADGLKEKANRCSELLKELVELKDSGRIEEAKKKAELLLSTNPNDRAAKRVLEGQSKLEIPIVSDTAEVSALSIEELAITKDSISKQISPIESAPNWFHPIHEQRILNNNPSKIWAIQTNLLDWAALGTINVEAGLSLSQHFSMTAGCRYNPWEFTTHKPDAVYRNQQKTVYFGFRYWPRTIYTGFWLSLKAQYMASFSNAGILRAALVEGKDGYGSGLSLGYTFRLSDRFKLEVGAGGWGGLFKQYCRYSSTEKHFVLEDSINKAFLSLDQVSLSLVYILE